MKWLTRFEFILGLWIVASPWILGYHHVASALWNSLISGILVMILGLWGLFGNTTEESLRDIHKTSHEKR